jgi:hypothetical protein
MASEKLLEVPFAIYERQSFEVKTPIGPRVVTSLTKIGEYKQNLPKELADEISKVDAFNRSCMYEGSATVLAQTQYGIQPHQILFLFADDVKTVQQAFDRFDEHMEKEIQRQEAESSKQKVMAASKSDLAALDSMTRGRKGGIIAP